MSLWDRTICFFFLMVVAVGCVDDNGSAIGIGDRDSPKLKIQYKELEVSSGIFFADSIRTSHSVALEEGKRLMVGQYTDNTFGTIKAQAYTQFRPYDHTVQIAADAKLVSGFLVLSFDYYYYGTKDFSSNSFTVHELANEIEADKHATASSSIAFDPIPIGEGTYGIGAAYFDNQRKRVDSTTVNIQRDEIDSLVIALQPAFISKLFEAAKAQTDDYTDFTKFRKLFPGITLMAGTTDAKIVGFNMDNALKTLSKSRIVLNYDEPDTTVGKDVRKTLVYSLYGVNNSLLRGFTQISADRGGTPLEGLTDFYTEFNPLGMRYYQSGNPVVPLVDFSRFLEFIDTIPNIVLNAVELSIDVEDADRFTPPSALQLRVLNKKNRFINIDDDALGENGISLNNGLIRPDEQGWLIVGEQQTVSAAFPSLLHLLYEEEEKRYYGDFTSFFQVLRYTAEKQTRPKRFGIVAQKPWIGFSVDRFWFNSENLKLKVFYTVPL